MLVFARFKIDETRLWLFLSRFVSLGKSLRHTLGQKLNVCVRRMLLHYVFSLSSHLIDGGDKAVELCRNWGRGDMKRK